MIEPINSLPNFTGMFNDIRIDNRATELLRSFVSTRKSAISKMSDNFAQQKSFYRLLSNSKFKEEIIKDATYTTCNKNCDGREVLAICDTVDFNLDNHKGRIELQNGFGLSANTTLGFKLHSSLIVDAQNSFPIGFSSIEIWNRPFDGLLKQARKYQSARLAEKESNKWLKGFDNTQANISEAKSITFVADREADIYDVLARPRAANIQYVIRSKSDRKTPDGQVVSHCLSKSAVQFEFDLLLEGDIRKNSKTRVAKLQVKYQPVTLTQPQSCKDTTLPKTTPTTVIEVSEVAASKTKIYWRLYTTHPVFTNEQAMQVVEWYKARWLIEQVHRLLKTEGLEIETTQLEKAASIRKLLAIALSATLRILQMHIAYNSETEEEIGIAFNEQEKKFLHLLSRKLEGASNKQKNPFLPDKLKWATWIIARLGTWKGYQSQRPPGVITLQKGLVKFYHMYEGWTLADELLVGKR